MDKTRLAFWAKTVKDQPGISVRDHCLDVGSVARGLVARLPKAADLSFPGAVTLASLHDVGKIAPGFQAKCEAWITANGLEQAALEGRWRMGCETDHAKVSQWVTQILLQDEDFYGWAMMLGAHHGKLKGVRLSRHHLSGSIGDQQWDRWRMDLARELIVQFGPIPLRQPSDAELWWTAGLITFADWIGSDTDLFPADDSGTDAERPARVETALDTIKWRFPAIRSGLTFTDLFPPHTPNQMQRAAMDVITAPGVYLIEGPMGSGKTEAALMAAYRLLETKQASGIYFALPTQMTSNAIHKRVQAFLEKIAVEPEAVRLAHSAAWMLDDDEYQFGNKEARAWFASAKRALLCPFGVGTIDQALMGVIAVRHFFLRQFGLAGKVVILDEVHTYDLYTGTLLDKLVERLRELSCTVMVLSATLTSQRREELGAVNVFSSYDGMPRSTVKVATTSASDAELAMACLERARAGQCVLWVRNTIRDAQNSYRALQEAGADADIGLLHSRFPLWRRAELEAHWLDALGKNSENRPNRCVLVATQIVEQSLDIDADFMITDLAPTDMLLQRIGRLWRHYRPERIGEPCVLINVLGLTLDNFRESSPEDLKRSLGRSARVYAPYVLLRSFAQWIRCTHLSLPEDIRRMVEATYVSTTDDPASLDELRQKLQEDGEELRAQAVNAALVRRQAILEDDERAVTRVTDIPTVPLLLCAAEPVTVRGRIHVQLIDGTEVSVTASKFLLPEAKKVHRNLVKIPFYVADHTGKPEWLKEYVTSGAVLGVVAEGGMIASGVVPGATWDREFGVILPVKEN